MGLNMHAIAASHKRTQASLWGSPSSSTETQQVSYIEHPRLPPKTRDVVSFWSGGQTNVFNGQPVSLGSGQHAGLRLVDSPECHDRAITSNGCVGVPNKDSVRSRSVVAQRLQKWQSSPKRFHGDHLHLGMSSAQL